MKASNLLYKHILLLLLTITIVAAVQEPETVGHVTTPSLNINGEETPEHDTEGKPRKRVGEKYPVGHFKWETKRDREIVRLLKKKGNGIRNYDSARRVADEHILKLRKHHSKSDQKLREIKKREGTFKPPTIKKQYWKELPKGYQSNENIIARRTRIIFKDNLDISQFEARKMAEKEFEEKQNLRKINRKLIKLSSPKKERIFKNPGKFTKEKKLKRKIDYILRKEDNNIDSPEEAKVIAEQQLEMEKIGKRESKRRSRLRKKAKLANEGVAGGTIDES